MKRIDFLKVVLAAATVFPVFPAVAQERLQADGVLRIVTAVTPKLIAEENSVERLQEMKECGINVCITGAEWETLDKILKNAQKAGVKLGIHPHGLDTAYIQRLMKYPALDFYSLADEPHADAFPKVGELVKQIQSVDTIHACYVNMLPKIPETLINGSYVEFVDSFLRVAPVPVISYDRYSIGEDENGKHFQEEGFYDNLEDILVCSQKHGLPFWTYVNAVPHASYPVPTVGELKLQQYSNLAYGAQGLQYFTYMPWPELDGMGGHTTRDAILGFDGKRTVIYDRVKRVNDEIQTLAGVFLGSKPVWVRHTGKRIPKGTKMLGALPEQIPALETGDSGAVVSLLERGNRRFLVIVNRDFQNPMKLTIATGDKVKRVRKDATLVPAGAYNPTTEVDPGDAMIYTWVE
ncbi:MAG: hypothetical protein LBK07_00685 [Tannerella sp.]|jgi:hypothetical protein|nr:hypothetical protein [Tannerella sp.]